MKAFHDYLAEQKLKGNQNKLDVNKNGKIDAEDFKLLKNNKVKKEYVDDQGKLVEKPESEEIADYKGPNPKSPPNKNASPYKPANDDVTSPTVKVEKDGLGNLGDEKLKYEPNTEYKQEVIKTKTEHFLNKTKNMSISEFTKYMLDECGCGTVSGDDLPYVTAYSSGKIQPHPPEAIKYVVVLSNKNDNILSKVVDEIKSNGLMGRFLKIMLSDPESYDELTNLFGDSEEGPNRCKMFAKSMNNSLEKFMKDQDSMYESVSHPIGFDDEDMEGMDDEEDFTDDDFDVKSDEEKTIKKKLKKKFAHHNLLNAMKQFKTLGENFTRDEVMSHPDMNNLKKYLQNIELRIDQAEKSKNIQELNNIKQELEYQIRDNKTALSKMNPQDRQKNVYLSTVSSNLQGKWEYVSNVINRVQRS